MSQIVVIVGQGRSHNKYYNIIIGAAITFITGRSICYSGFRQALFGLMAAAITFGIGRIIGISVAD
ncbi:MAG: hypothetical protein IPL46_30200 [Saprospiraceae bacterium]|nr:hypothetical protein [Saprospiraceae bacterium]